MNKINNIISIRDDEVRLFSNKPGKVGDCSL